MESFPPLTLMGAALPDADRREPPLLYIDPPLLNSACPWSTTPDQLRELLECPSVGAVTTRTSLIRGFNHDPVSHRFAFFDPTTGRNLEQRTYSFPDHASQDFGVADGDADLTNGQAQEGRNYDERLLGGEHPPETSGSLNSLGYSPITLGEYLDILRRLGRTASDAARRKTVIISVTGTEGEVQECYDLIVSLRGVIPFKLAMEVNLSCPNIEGSSPLAYDRDRLASFVKTIHRPPLLPVGIKFPPYTYKEQFLMVRSALEEAEARKRLTFITTTNTLGNCIITEDGDPSGSFTLPNAVGGMAGPPLHPLALGNVRQMREWVLGPVGGNIGIIGVGGVSDGKGYLRMRSAGAKYVALATALGRKGGVRAFEDIEREIQGVWNGFGPPTLPGERARSGAEGR